MAEQEFATPEDAAQALAANPELQTGQTSTATVCLGPTNSGYFQLSWVAQAIGPNDWAGLYASTSAPDNDYQAFQWATKDSPYDTGKDCQPGYEARYLIWDAPSKAYKSIARTGGYPASICSS
jgi:hypothetical protein